MLRQRIYEHHDLKLQKRLCKGERLELDRLFEEVLKEDSIYRLRQNNNGEDMSIPHINENEVDLIESLQAIYASSKKYLKTPSDKRRRDLACTFVLVSGLFIEVGKKLDEKRGEKESVDIFYDMAAGNIFSKCDNICDS